MRAWRWQHLLRALLSLRAASSPEGLVVSAGDTDALRLSPGFLETALLRNQGMCFLHGSDILWSKFIHTKKNPNKVTSPIFAHLVHCTPLPTLVSLCLVKFSSSVCIIIYHLKNTCLSQPQLQVINCFTLPKEQKTKYRFIMHLMTVYCTHPVSSHLMKSQDPSFMPVPPFPCCLLEEISCC